MRSLLSPQPTKQPNKILFTIPPRVRCRLFSKKEQKSNKKPIIDKNFAETLKKMNSTNQLNLTIDDEESHFISSKSSSSSIMESNIYEDSKEIEEITTPPSSQIESTHTSPNTITSESPIKYRVYSTITSTINSEDDDSDEESVFSPLHSLNSSPYSAIISTPPKISKTSNNTSFNNSNVSPLPINDYDYNANISTTDSPPAVKRTVRIMNNSDIYDDDDNYEKRRKLNKHVLSSNVEFELSINTSVYCSQYETVNYPTVSIIQDLCNTRSSSFNKFLIGKRSKSILKMYRQNEYNIA